MIENKIKTMYIVPFYTVTDDGISCDPDFKILSLSDESDHALKLALVSDHYGTDDINEIMCYEAEATLKRCRHDVYFYIKLNNGCIVLGKPVKISNIIYKMNGYNYEI